ncbi:MAG: hypothetical protein HC771_06175 [Synechococcales cyanobacterium CRU_2_2]|nr:hypothetical protein [Synechococcales cyanobacterium CRU_2_2]
MEHQRESRFEAQSWLARFGGSADREWGDRPPALAEPAAVFQPYIQEMLRNMPPGFPVRLPSKILVEGNYILLNGEAATLPLKVEVYASQTPLSLVVSLLSCDSAQTRSPCVFGTVTTDRSSAPHAQQELSRHRKQGDRITFRPGVQGYLIDSARSRSKSPSKFSSVSWQQDNAIYTLSFPATSERQDLIDMAASMALSPPVRAQLPPSIPASTIRR